MRVCKNSCDVFNSHRRDLRIILKKQQGPLSMFTYPPLNTRGQGKFLKVVQTLNNVCLKFLHCSLCLDDTIFRPGKSALLVHI